MPTVLAVMAHPDDIEFLCAGTLALLGRAGWDLQMATMTAGDLGSMTLGREQIAQQRREEAQDSAVVLGAGCTCLEFHDLAIVYGEEAKRRVTGLLRKTRPDLLITHDPADYMGDHEETARIAREAAFASTIPNWTAPGGLPPCAKIPPVLYADPIENKDRRGRRVKPDQVVDITAAFETKERMLGMHRSQRDWLRAQHGEDEYLESMRRWGADRARDFGRKTVRFAEGFTRHLGHGFPKTDVLTEVLGKRLVKSLP